MLVVLAKALHTHPSPSHAQLKAGNYAKRVVKWQGLDIAIENEVGSTRRGKKPDGTPWETKMKHAYGYAKGSTGVDGDEVDIFLGPNLETSEVYIVHQNTVGQWDKYDEDKCMVGYSSEAAARQAFLDNYDDPRFLGPITTMPVAEFVAKVKATKDKPAMIKAVLFCKAFVKPHLRTVGGKTVTVSGYATRVNSRIDQPDLFAKPSAPEPTATPAEPVKKRGHYCTVVRHAGSPKQRVGYLAGPFESEEEARTHLPAAKAKARELDPWTDFDAFGTASFEALHHKPGVLNQHLGL